MTSPCPTPQKTGKYATERAANNAARRREVSSGLRLRTYECECGWWHLTREIRSVHPRTARGPQQLAALPDDQFRDLVREEVHGRAHPDEVRALRDPALLHRWEKELTSFVIDVERQFALRKGEKTPAVREWRKKAVVLKTAIVNRRMEVRAYINPGRNDTQARSEVWERSVRRLIDSHRDEFTRYVIDEYAAAGLQAPDRVLRHLTTPELRSA